MRLKFFIHEQINLSREHLHKYFEPKKIPKSTVRYRKHPFEIEYLRNVNCEYNYDVLNRILKPERPYFSYAISYTFAANKFKGVGIASEVTVLGDVVTEMSIFPDQDLFPLPCYKFYLNNADHRWPMFLSQISID